MLIRKIFSFRKKLKKIHIIISVAVLLIVLLAGIAAYSVSAREAMAELPPDTPLVQGEDSTWVKDPDNPVGTLEFSGQPGNPEADADNTDESASSETGWPEEEIPVIDENTIIIFIDPGPSDSSEHSPFQPDAAEDGGFLPVGLNDQPLDSDINSSVAYRLKSILEGKGYIAVILQNNSPEASLFSSSNTSALISLRHRTDEDSARSVEIAYGGPDTDDELPQLLLKEVLSATSMAGNGLRQDDSLIETLAERFGAAAKPGVPLCLVLSVYSPGEDIDSVTLQNTARGIAEGIDRYFRPKVLYLTFDDGPKPGTTDIVLDILRERGIKATFFVVGKNVLKYPELARRIAEEGHTVGIHSHTHIYNEIYASVENYVKDFTDAYDAVVDIMGISPELFRFPGGSINSHNRKVYKDIIQEMTDRGFSYFDWNASVEDAYKNASSETILQNALATVGDKSRAVLLAHDSVAATAEALPALLDLFADYPMDVLTPDTKPVRFGS